MSDAELAGYKRRLQAQLQALRDQAGALRERLAADDNATANTFVAGTEGAMASESDDEVIALLQHEQAELAATAAALARIEQGSFGACVACGEPIGAARLDALPEAELCVDCQDVQEHRRGH